MWVLYGTKQLANQANISMTTNRSCTLRCNHCYIEPHLLASKDKISINDYKLSFDKVDELYNFDQGLEEVEWEVMGGETTMMPFDFWQEMLPWSLDRIERFNKEHHLWINGHLNFLTNFLRKTEKKTQKPLKKRSKIAAPSPAHSTMRPGWVRFWRLPDEV